MLPSCQATSATEHVVPGFPLDDPHAGQRAPDLEVGWLCPRCGGFNGALSGEYPIQCVRCTWAPSFNTVEGVARVDINLSGVALNDFMRRQFHEFQSTLPASPPASNDHRRIRSPSWVEQRGLSRRNTASRSRDRSEERPRTRRRTSMLSNSELSNKGVDIDLDACDLELLNVLRRANNSPDAGYRRFYQDCLAQPRRIREALLSKGQEMMNSPDGQVRCGGVINRLVEARREWKAEVRGVQRSHQKWRCQCGAWSFMDWDACHRCAALLENACIEHPWRSPPPAMQPPAQRSSGSSGHSSSSSFRFERQD